MAPRCGCGCSTPPSSGPATGSTSTTWTGRPSPTRVRATDLLVLGAGPAGVGAAFRAARAGHRVVVLERGQGPGGAAGSFELDGIRVDHGSHRLHPAIEPRILADLRGLLGEELQRRPRNGRIFLEGRWIRFPLRPADLARRLPPSFAAAAARDAATAWARRPRADTFAEVRAVLLPLRPQAVGPGPVGAGRRAGPPAGDGRLAGQAARAGRARRRRGRGVLLVPAPGLRHDRRTPRRGRRGRRR